MTKTTRKVMELLCLVSPSRPAPIDDIAYDLEVTRGTVIFWAERMTTALGVSLILDREAGTVLCRPESWARCQQLAEEYLEERGE